MLLTNHFYFQVRESSATLNIPAPTPAPDRGGPVALLQTAVELDPTVALLKNCGRLVSR